MASWDYLKFKKSTNICYSYVKEGRATYINYIYVKNARNFMSLTKRKLLNRFVIILKKHGSSFDFRVFKDQEMLSNYKQQITKSKQKKIMQTSCQTHETWNSKTTKCHKNNKKSWDVVRRNDQDNEMLLNLQKNITNCCQNKQISWDVIKRNDKDREMLISIQKNIIKCSQNKQMDIECS